jgi:hypothetical protein
MYSVEGMKKKSKKDALTQDVRQCLNIKSRKHPDIQCPLQATQGEYCTRHTKNPVRFHALKKIQSADESLEKIQSAVKIQTWWLTLAGIQRYKRQGPAVNIPAVAENQSDIYTLDSVTAIPVIYRWSYGDSKKHIWIFDVRSLCMIRAEEGKDALLNPYTREEITASAVKQFQDRCLWLRKRNYCIVHTDSVELTDAQRWHQKILDVTLKYDMMGYHMCLSWFEELNIRQLIGYYIELWELWFFRLNLNAAVKTQVVPNWQTTLFKHSPLEMRQRTEKRWWQQTVLDLMDTLVSSAQLKEHKTLGALYSMTAFATVSPNVRQHYPWLVDMEEDDI